MSQPPRLTPENILTARQLYATGVAPAAIAKQFKVHPSTIYRVLRGAPNGKARPVHGKPLSDSRKVNLIHAVTGNSSMPDDEILDTVRVIIEGY